MKRNQGVEVLRFPEGKIKQAILHPDLDIRAMAVGYFAKSYSPDPSVMPLVIQAVETFGRETAFHLIGAAREIAQTADTIAWIIDELNQEQGEQGEQDEQNEQNVNYIYNLSMVLLNADVALLLPRESEILESRHFLPGFHSSFTERLRMFSWDEKTCWQELHAFCEEGKDKQYVNEIDWRHGKRIVEALARQGSSCEEQVHVILHQRVDDFRHHPMRWMEPLVVHLAGQARLESTIPLIVGKLEEDGDDLLNQACAEALARIGTPAVLEAISQVYPKAPRHFRIYASDPMENIRSDLAVETCLECLRQEKHRSLQIHLASALLHQFATEGIEEARTLLVGHKLDFESRELRSVLVEACLLMEERFPELDKWRREIRTEREEHQIRVKELENDPAGLMKFALEKLTGEPSEPEPPSPPTPLTKIGGKQKIGRNDPCPCGSGKKYKKCCLNKP